MANYKPTKLTIRFVDTLPWAERDERGRVLSYSVRDTVVKGLMVVVHASSKTYAVQRDLYAQERDAQGRRVKLGTRRVRLGDARDFLSIEAVRTKALEVIEQVRAGIDPNKPAVPEAPKKEFTFAQALDSYIDRCERKARRPSTIDGYRNLFERYLKDWADRPLKELGDDTLGVDERHRHITKKNGPVAANQTMRLVRAVYRHARRKLRDLPPPPTDAVDFNDEKRRDVIITDWPAFWATVHELRNPVTRDWYLFLAFTGMRRGATSEARIEHLNLEKGFLHVPNPKGGPKRAFDLPLSGFLVEMLRNRAKENCEIFGKDYPWLFPSHTSATGYITQGLKANQGLVNPHALRHSFATAATAAGLDPFAIKLLLNHQLPGVTGGYIHGSALGVTLREAQERVTAYLLGQIHGNVLALPRRAVA
ncbi:tyrosine-type recombinase/integrase [Accumulibacter sp.]|uniref:tyrosine-type recombinase/integrase n=1 Tax=Accumulibacter sp. TaxID=2053492 RepID=UPI002602DCDA|nr:tyrosine-type recombinase/integrase [Accumulibacter sp.]